MSSKDPLAEGQTIGDVTFPVSGGEVALSDFPGKKIVVYVYPRDNTPGCTVEANEFQALLPEFEAAGAVVIGVSKDSLASHDRFAEKQGLSFALASDKDGHVLEDWGAFGEKQMYGKTVMGTKRMTFLIRDGKVEKIWKVARAKGHAQKVLEAVKAL